MEEALAQYLTDWDLSQPELIATTATSAVYTVMSGGAKVVLKLLTPIGVEDESPGAIALRWFEGRGAVRLLREDGQAQLLEYADGNNLAALVGRGEDERAAEIIGETLNQLHRIETPPEGLWPLRRRFDSLFVRAEADHRAGSRTVFVRGAAIAEALLDAPGQICALHGDMHHENVRFKDGRGWLAFDPKGVIGERTFDTANTLCNPWGFPELTENEDRLLRIADILARTMGVELGRLLRFGFAYACLSTSWSLDIGEDDTARHMRAVAENIEPHLPRG